MCARLQRDVAEARQRLDFLYTMEQFAQVVVEAERCRAAIHLCEEFAERDEDRVDRKNAAGVVVVQARAAVALALNQCDFVQALFHVDQGLQELLALFIESGSIRAYDRAQEVRTLERCRRDILDKIFPGPRAEMRSALSDAIREERYEEAARLRDRLKRRG